MANIPSIGQPEWASEQASPWVSVNMALRALAAYADGLIVQSRSYSSPPGGESDGDCFLIDTGPSGTWSIYAQGDAAVALGDLASNGWLIIPAAFVNRVGMHLFVVDENAAFRSDGVGWVPDAGGGVGTGATRLQDLTDVSIVGLLDSYVMKYDASSGIFYFAQEGISGIAYHGALATLSADLGSANYTAGVAVAFNTDLHDTDAIHDTVTNNTRMTVPAGVSKVRLKGQIAYNGTGTSGSYAKLTITKNGSAAYQGVPQQIIETTTTLNTVNVSSAVLAVVPGDYFELVYTSESDTSEVLVQNLTWFGMEIVE